MTKQTDDAISAIRKALEADDGTAVYYKGVISRVSLACNPSAIRALLAELDAARKDAARYRWLRNVENIRTAFVNWNIGHDWVDIHFEQLDAAVDAALNAERKNDA